MLFQEVQSREKEYLMPTYNRFPVAIASGSGAKAVGTEGKEYIDFGSGIGVNSLGYCDPQWVKAVSEQAATLQHISNLYFSPVSIQLGEKLCGASGYSKVFFANSGAEANEGAIKLARKYSNDKYGEGRGTVITLVQSFHGRTITTLTATGQEKHHQHFTPFTPGFAYAKANDLESVKALADNTVCAVMLEMIQGEGGVLPLNKEFVQGVAAFCKENDILLLVDEVQTGVARTGSFFCFEQFGIIPDVVSCAKGLGGGLPIGAVLCTEELKDVLGAGHHGTTFGGNPICAAGALVVLERVTAPGFLEEVQKKGEYLREKLLAMPQIAGVRGMGMMLGASLKQGEAGVIAKACVKNGLLILTAHDVLRLLPPLTISYKEIDKGMQILQKTLEEELS